MKTFRNPIIPGFYPDPSICRVDEDYYLLKVEAVEQDYSFFFATQAETWTLLAGHVDGRILSTDVAGGFVGAYIGMYASSNGQPSTNVADFDWFEYVGW